jgi:photosystem II stability/assembly factor-like uncharacterized protein
MKRTIKNSLVTLIFIVSCVILIMMQSTSEMEINEMPKKEKKPGSILRKEYMESFYYPKSVDEVSQERAEYLSTNGSFNSLGEEPDTDTPVLPWVSVGPRGVYSIPAEYDFSGRVISFAMHGDNTNILYCGGASGGLWKSTNGGNNWFVLVDTLSCPTVSSIAVSRLSSDNTVYFSTGSFYNGSGPQFARVYRSTNGGTSWTKITSIPDNTQWVQKIEVNTYNKNHVYIATNGGLYKSTNGTSFALVYNQNNISDVITYTNFILPDTLNVVIGRDRNGIYRSTNGGLSFSAVSLPSYNTAIDERISLASDPATGITYALVGRDNGSFLGIWSSSNKGLSWIQRTLPSATGGQSRYNQGIAVSPNGRVYCGYNSRAIFISTNQGMTWTSSSNVHEDIQKIHVYNNSLMYHVSDGGVFRSVNQGTTWQTVGGTSLTLSQSYTLTPSESDPNLLWSGMQDIGLNSGFDSFNKWFNVACCDGGDYLRTGGYQYMTIVGIGNNSPNKIQRKLVTAPHAGPWEPFATGLPTGDMWTQAGMNDLKYSASALYTSVNQFVYKKNISASSWSQLGSRPHPSNDIFIGRIIPIANYILAGFDIGTSPQLRIYNPTNSSWETPSLVNIPQNTRVTDFDKGLELAGRVYMTVSGTSGARIFKSTNIGYNWTDITGNLPNLVNASSILVNKSNENVIYVGSDFGVYVTTNGGVSWFNFSQGLPRVALIRDMEFSAGNQFIYAATHGRGVFKTNVAVGITPVSTNIPDKFDLYQNYPNPFNPATKITFDIPANVRGITKLVVYDIAGREVSLLVNRQLSPGSYEYSFDGSNLPSGVYFYRLQTDGYVKTKKMMLVK